MSKPQKQKDAESFFDDLVGDVNVDLNPAEFKLIKKLCVEMYRVGHREGVFALGDKVDALAIKLAC